MRLVPALFVIAALLASCATTQKPRDSSPTLPEVTNGSEGGEGGEASSFPAADRDGGDEGSDESPVEEVSGLLRVHVINVGQADGIAVECPEGGVGMVIDSSDWKGPEKEHFQNYLTSLMAKDVDGTIPLVVASHPHADHIGDLAWVLESFRVSNFVDNGQNASSATFRQLNEAIQQSVSNGTAYLRLDSPSAWLGSGAAKWQICNQVAVEAVLPPSGFLGCRSGTNNCSLVLRLDFGSTSYLFAGDAERGSPKKWLHQPSRIESNPEAN